MDAHTYAVVIRPEEGEWIAIWEGRVLVRQSSFAGVRKAARAELARIVGVAVDELDVRFFREP